MALSQEDKKEIVEIIQTTVNGKIDRLSDKFDVHAKEMAPIRQGWETVQNGRRFIIWIAAPLAAIGALISFFK